MRALVPIVFTVAALASAVPATAKEPVRVVVCGASACRTITDRAAIDGVPAGEQTRPLGPAAPYYRFELVSREPGHGEFSFFLYYVPSERAVAIADDGLVRLHPIFGREANALMRRLSRGLAAFPTPTVGRVRVGSRVVTGPAAATYLGLFDYDERATLVESPDDWIPIDLEARVGSPWTDGRVDLVYSPSTNLLEHGWTRAEVPAAIASDIEGARALDGGDDGTRWPLLAAAAAVVAALLLAAQLVRARAGARRALARVTT